MKNSDLHKHFNSISPISDQAWFDLQLLFKPVSLKRNEHLIREGAHAHACYLLTDGILRVYYCKSDTEYNKTFFIPGMFPTPLTALLSGKHAAISFQALMPSELIEFSYAGFRKLFATHRCLESLMLKILELQWIKKERHDIHMVTNDATANYLIFREEYPGLENQIAQYHIASYLGITPIQLSRIRGQMLKNT